MVEGVSVCFCYLVHHLMRSNYFAAVVVVVVDLDFGGQR